MNRLVGLGLLAVLAVVPMSGCKSKPPRSPRILGSTRPTVPMQAPPLNSRVPVDVPSAPVGTPVTGVAAQPAFALPAQPAVAVPVPAVQAVPARQVAPPNAQIPVPNVGPPPEEPAVGGATHLIPPPEPNDP